MSPMSGAPRGGAPPGRGGGATELSDPVALAAVDRLLAGDAAP